MVAADLSTSSAGAQPQRGSAMISADLSTPSHGARS
jgi:hypothetical protein